MQKSLLKIVVVVFCCAFCFFAGMFVGPNGSNLKSKMKGWRYTASLAQKLYDQWDKDALFFESGGGTLSQFVQNNGTFILYNWASWCPHCKKINSDLQKLQNAAVPTIALTFDTDWDSYRLYREKNALFWRDLVHKTTTGENQFVIRENEFDVPLIPSVWIVQDGKIKKIFVGESGVPKLFSYLEKSNLLKN